MQFLEACTQHRDEAGLALQFDTTALPALCDVKAVPGRVSAVLPVTPAVSNRYGTLHGGCIGQRDWDSCTFSPAHACRAPAALLNNNLAALPPHHIAAAARSLSCMLQLPWWTPWALRRWSQPAPRAGSA